MPFEPVLSLISLSLWGFISMIDMVKVKILVRLKEEFPVSNHRENPSLFKIIEIKMTI